MKCRCLLMRMGCAFGRHQWGRWNYYRSEPADDWALWKYRRCILCGKYQEDVLTRIEADHDRDRRNSQLHFDPG